MLRRPLPSTVMSGSAPPGWRPQTPLPRISPTEYRCKRRPSPLALETRLFAWLTSDMACRSSSRAIRTFGPATTLVKASATAGADAFHVRCAESAPPSWSKVCGLKPTRNVHRSPPHDAHSCTCSPIETARTAHHRRISPSCSSGGGVADQKLQEFTVARLDESPESELIAEVAT